MWLFTKGYHPQDRCLRGGFSLMDLRLAGFSAEALEGEDGLVAEHEDLKHHEVIHGLKG